ncbi:hypothetical protein SAMN04488134_101374 [Amphibacillus marinus]|uniref:Uncharacterized protein n=1 Tax=Amphibacillus marinus TaxID=872970 RepID=A0A1H8HKM9_9BACI|nr:hypothetical protein [Amphibacillus marinus]SEN56741.1 hypothetical protein SAMN04488134_101374 [Amphibacillus marinus]
MKKTMFKILSVLFFCSLVFGSNVFAARETLNLPSRQSWVDKAATRSGTYNDVRARLYSVYPPNGGTDNFTRIQVVVATPGNLHITDTVTLNETATSNTSIKLRNGTLNNRSIKFRFRGNNPDYAAKADVEWQGR